MDERDVRFRVAMARRILAREGCESGVAGHVSVRSDEPSSLWISPFAYFDEALPEHVVRVGFDLTILDGTWIPSPAVEFHSKIYQARPDVQAVVHHHGPFVTTVSTTGRVVGMYNVDAVLFAGEQSLLEEDGIHPPADGERIVTALGAGRVVLIKNHGAIVVGDSLENATVCAFTLERVARCHLEAVAAGGSELVPEYAAQTKPFMHRYFLPETWAACERRLRRSDPDLFSRITSQRSLTLPATGRVAVDAATQSRSQTD